MKHDPLNTKNLPEGDFAYYGEYVFVAKEDWSNRSQAWRLIKDHAGYMAEKLKELGKQPLEKMERIDKAPSPMLDIKGLWGTVGWRQKWSK